MYESLIGFLKETDIKFEEFSRLDTLSYMRAGGSARILASPTNEEELCQLLSYLFDRNIPNKVIGKMSNILPQDGLYNGVVVKTREINSKTVAENTVCAQCGAALSDIIWSAAHLGLGGCEELFMIPATLGGAIYNNAGAHGRSVSDLFVSARLYNLQDRSVREYSVREMCFSYRDSVLKHKSLYLLSATLRFKPSDFSCVKERIEHFARLRRSAQPIELPSLGSIFKRYDGVGAGFYIDKAGLKGYRIGGAVISEKHAGFIVNSGGACADDVIKLIRFTKETVKERFGITLEEEIEII